MIIVKKNREDAEIMQGYRYTKRFNSDVNDIATTDKIIAAHWSSDKENAIK